MITDVIIIGGGAAGLTAAVYLKQINKNLSVRILEALPRVCKKLALTGNGRCNITNKNISLSRYHGKNVEFCRFALEKYGLNFTKFFFEKIGVPFVFEEEKAYPSSLQASSVVDCLRFAADELGVITHTETKVTNILASDTGYKVVAGNLSFLAKNVIVATGLFSGGERLGSDGSILNILKKAGFKAERSFPAIVQVKTETDIVKQLKGIKIHADVSLRSSGKLLRKEFGEVLFCDYGLSGPPVLQVSGEIADKKDCEISLDLMPETDFDKLYNILRVRKANLSKRTLDEFFTGMLNKRVGQVVLKIAGCKLNATAESLDDDLLRKITAKIKALTFNVTGTTGFANSQVSSGGLSTDQFNNKTMMCKNEKGFYAVGEILDIYGDCGGFNLQWAWSSAFCAADNILKDNI